jgi:hypothetical protein
MGALYLVGARDVMDSTTSRLKEEQCGNGKGKVHPITGDEGPEEE